MIKRSSVRFDHLRGILEGLGFQAHRRKRGWLFEHASSGAEFIFKAYRSNEHVYAIHLDTVRSHLDWRGLMTPDAFDRALTKTPA